LQSLERECFYYFYYFIILFSIPVRYLFDFFIGADTEALLALAVGSTQPPMPLGLKGVEGRFCSMRDVASWVKHTERSYVEEMRCFLESHDQPVERTDTCPCRCCASPATCAPAVVRTTS
jgi:hypothetical protein